MDNTKYSIIVPTCNRKELLLELIKTINLEDESLNELIIVDSSDKNYNIEIINENKKINYIFTDTRSASIQRNTGIKHLSNNSQYVFFLDDDVKPDKDYFRLLLETIKQSGAIGASGIALEYNFTNNKHSNFLINSFKRIFLLDSKIGGSLLKSAVNIPIQGRFKKNNNLYNSNWLIGCSIWDVNIFSKIQFPKNFFGQSLGEDVLFSAKARDYGKLVVNSKIILWHEMANKERPNKKEHYIMWVRNRFIISRELNLSKFNVLFHWANLGALIGLVLNLPKKKADSLKSIIGIFLGYKALWRINDN